MTGPVVRCTECPDGCPDPGRTPKCSECRREAPAPLVIEGNLPLARITADGQTALRDTRRALVTGGRGLLHPVERKPFRQVGDSDGILVLSIALSPEIERRIRVSGGTLSEEEIVAGLEQIREDDEDVKIRLEAEMRMAYTDGYRYTMRQMELALNGDEAALGRAWETARKTMALLKRLQRDATGPSVEGQSVSGRSPVTDTTGGQS
jgi:hypothetical protein